MVISISDLEEKDCISFLPLHDGSVVKCLRVIDGDTLVFGWFRDGVAQKMSLRLEGFDAAELHSKDPLEKKHALYAKEKLEEICQDKLIVLTKIKLDKYGNRIVSDASVGNIPSVAKYMLQFEHCCKPYFGKKKEEWTFDGPPPHRKVSMIPPPVRKLSHQIIEAIKTIHF